MTKEACNELKSEGRFHRSFDYDAMGTNFFKTTVNSRQVDGEYILEITAAFVGNKPEENLAEKLGKERALIASSAIGKLSVVDDWWFNINLGDMFQTQE